MKRDLFRRYVWLIETIRHSGKITFDEISYLWTKSPVNEDGAPLALRTFHNHRDAIENLFGIRIFCDRSDHHRYYVDTTMGLDRLKIWMLQTLSLSDMIMEEAAVESRVLLDMTPDEKFGIISVIEAMKDNNLVDIEYINFESENAERLTVAPYCVRFFNRCWYLLAREPENGQMLVFDLSRVKKLTVSDRKFTYELDFDPSEFFKNYYGVDVDSTGSPEDIRLKVTGKTRDELHHIRLHHSQEELESGDGYTIFGYRFVPGEHFKRTVLAMGPEVEVLAPENFRQVMSKCISEMAGNYRTAAEN